MVECVTSNLQGENENSTTAISRKLSQKLWNPAAYASKTKENSRCGVDCQCNHFHGSNLDCAFFFPWVHFCPGYTYLLNIFSMLVSSTLYCKKQLQCLRAHRARQRITVRDRQRYLILQFILSALYRIPANNIERWRCKVINLEFLNMRLGSRLETYFNLFIYYIDYRCFKIAQSHKFIFDHKCQNILINK